MKKRIPFDTKVQYTKYKILREVAKYSFAGTLTENLMNIPKTISPGPKAEMRCCVYKERAIVGEQVALAVSGVSKGENVISVVSIACDECPAEGYIVNHDCRGCLAHRCKNACRRNAISFDENLRAVIDKTKCVNCGLCAQACPFNAIVNRKRPCMAACKCNAITTADDMSAKIIDEKCITCGACVYQCPFGAITDRSSIVQIIEQLKNADKHVYAILAPAFAVQFDNAKVGQVITGLKQLGFYQVFEAALGADMVALSEAQELAQKGQLTSSCCPAFVRFIKTNYPSLVEKISHNPSPMVALSRYIKSIDDKACTVFIGPCTAKKREALESEGATDFVMTFEELQAVFSGKGIDITELEETTIDNASYFGRIFGRIGGLSEAAVQALNEQNIQFDVKPEICDGIENIKRALARMKKGDNTFNFLEGMICLGGCIGGPCNLTHEIKDKMDIDKFGRTSTQGGIVDSAQKTQQ